MPYQALHVIWIGCNKYFVDLFLQKYERENRFLCLPRKMWLLLGIENKIEIQIFWYFKNKKHCIFYFIYRY